MLTPQEGTTNVTRPGPLLYLAQSIVAYDAESMGECEGALVERVNTLGVDLNCKH